MIPSNSSMTYHLTRGWQVLVITRLIAASASVSSCSALEAKLPVTINPGRHRDEAYNTAAYTTFRIVAEPVIGEEAERMVYDFWQTEFPQFSIGDIKNLTWKIDPLGGQKHRFVLWPLKIEPKREGDARFDVRAWDDLNIDMRKEACNFITADGDFSGADKKYKEFAPFCARFPAEWTLKGITPAAFHHVFLSELTAAADKFRTKSRWRQKTSDERKACEAIEGDWRLKLITNNEGQTDDDSLARLTEAAVPWWNFATARDTSLKKGEWQSGKYESDESFLSSEHAVAFRKDFERLLDCLRDPEVKAVLDTKVAAKLSGTLPAKRQEQLNLWTKWKEETIDDKPISLGQIELILDGLRWVFKGQ
jgi:hypothetical protein